MLRTSDLDYELPEERIATRPAEPRDAARLMVVPRAEPSRPEDRVVRELPEILRAGDLLVLNITTVMPARFRGGRVGTTGKMEGLFLGEEAGQPARWRVYIKARHTREGAEFELSKAAGGSSAIRLRVAGRSESEPGAWVVDVSGAEGRSARECLEEVGLPPLPPYILAARKHAGLAEDDPTDRQRYQTVFADRERQGSVAAPTAGLHFTPGLLERLESREVKTAAVTLSVGSGTFKPVETEFVEQHPMHAEWCSMSAATIEAVHRTRSGGGRVIAVGTTAARTLEAYAAEIAGDKGPRPEWLQTRLLITPGYQFRWVDGLLTNYHLPRSTLMALVASLLPGDGVERLKQLYARALAGQYRFYSYGDAMLIV